MCACVTKSNHLPAVAGTPQSFSSELINFSTQEEREFKLEQAAFDSPGGRGRLWNLIVLKLWTVLLAQWSSCVCDRGPSKVWLLSVYLCLPMAACKLFFFPLKNLSGLFHWMEDWVDFPESQFKWAITGDVSFVHLCFCVRNGEDC